MSSQRHRTNGMWQNVQITIQLKKNMKYISQNLKKKENQPIIYIVPSPKEHAAREGIQKQINDMHLLENKLTKTQNKWNVAKRSNNNTVERKYEIYFTELEKIKTEIELYIQKLTSLINNRHN
eukprot:148992_1